MTLYTHSLQTPDGAALAFHLSRSGRLMVLAHAHTGTMASFGALLPRLTRPVLLWDRRGYGGSTRGAGYGSCRQEEDLALLLDHLGAERVDLAGLAAGGACMAAFAARWPERVGRLVLISSFIGQPAAFWQAATGEAAPQGDAAARELSAAFRATPAAEGWRAMAQANHAAGAGEPPQPCTVDLAALRGVADLHIWTGDQDRLFTPAMLAHAQHLLPHARTALLPGVAHAGPMEDPALVARLLNAREGGKDLSPDGQASADRLR